ncbi:MAG: hypothetical protein ACLTX6_11985 [Lachnospiraceae bacterium]
MDRKAAAKKQSVKKTVDMIHVKRFSRLPAMSEEGASFLLGTEEIISDSI